MIVPYPLSNQMDKVELEGQYSEVGIPLYRDLEWRYMTEGQAYGGNNRELP
jgi:hypothetical protein